MAESDTDLPKTLIKRIVKRHLNQIDKGDAKRDTQINKDALLAFSESAKVFINYITATANDICKEHKRQTISVDDILKALEDTDFLELLTPLKQSLDAFKKDTKEKNQKKAEAKKRKAEQQLEAEQQQEQQTEAEAFNHIPAVGETRALDETRAPDETKASHEIRGLEGTGALDEKLAHAAEPMQVDSVQQQTVVEPQHLQPDQAQAVGGHATNIAHDQVQA